MLSLLGLPQYFSAVVVVELIALAVPRWRQHRFGPQGRARLATASTCVAFVFLAFMAWTFVSFVGQGAFSDIVKVIGLLSLFGGTLALVVLASFVNKHGIGNGYVVVMLGPMAIEAYELAEWLAAGHTGAAITWFVIIISLAVAGIALLLGWSRRPKGSRLQLPTSGFVPIVWAATLLELSETLSGLSGAWVARVAIRIDGWTLVGLTLLLSLVLSAAFSRPRTAAASSARRIFFVASIASAFGLAALVALEIVTREFRPDIGPNLFWLAILTAAVMDIVADIRAHRRDRSLVAIWPIHRVQLVETALSVLASRGIGAHAKSLYIRKLFFFFAPFFPIMIMVPRGQAEEAFEVLEANFGALSSEGKAPPARVAV